MTRPEKARAARAARELAADRKARDEALDLVWALVPDVDCKGLCHGACGPIAMSEAERDRLWRRRGLLIEDAAATVSGDCPALSADKRCRGYEDRPTICRVYGAVEGLKCPHGCEPVSGRLSDADGSAVLTAARAVDGVRAPRKGRDRG